MPMDTKPSGNDKEKAWEDLVQALASGKLSLFEVIKGGSTQLLSDGNYEQYVMMTRAMEVLLSDQRILKRFHSELGEEMEKATGKKPDVKKIERVLKSKDGRRRFKKLSQVHVEMYSDGPPLITGQTFDECLKQYLRLIRQVENLWDQACLLYRQKTYPLSTFISILTIEEVGKLSRLWFDLLGWDRPIKTEKRKLGRLGKDHRNKHFMAVIAGALINARLDRVLGIENIKQLLHEAESGKLEKLRQACLYIDIVDGKIVTPDDIIGAGIARFFVVLAGELWAETLGHFPWEFEKMIGKVTAFETDIGFRKTDIERS
jgi:AbiV family abortive infection protein